MIRLNTSDVVYAKMLDDDENPDPTKAKVERRTPCLDHIHALFKNPNNLGSQQDCAALRLGRQPDRDTSL